MSMGIVLGVCFVVFFVIGLPLPFAIALSSVLALTVGDMPLVLIAQRMYMGTDSFPMLAIPFFVLSGEIMLKGGLSKRLIQVANSLIGHLTGGLAMTSVASAAFFGAISGSAPATTASIGSIMVPEMKKAGYDEDFSAALVASVGPLGQIIPPSIPMVLWATMAGISVSDLFLAGVFPGILMALALCICSYIIAKRRGFRRVGKRAPAHEVFHALKEGIWALLMPVIILGSIYGGVCSPTEAGGVVCFYALFVGFFIYRELKIKDMMGILINTVKTTAMVVFMVGCANLFGWIMASEQLPAKMVSGFLSVSGNKFVILFLLNVALLITGALMDNISAMTILCAVLTGIGSAVGMDPIQLGAIIVINFAIGNITPPVGYTLYVAAGITGQPFERIAKNAMPMLLCEILVLLIITYIPFFTLALI